MHRKFNILTAPEATEIPRLRSEKITPELIPHSEFHTGRWLHSLKKKGWYYFLKEKNTNSIKNKSFIKSLDLQLRELVSFLHHKNIQTTPSCAGHHIKRSLLEKIYSFLEDEREQILNRGLELKDVESGEVFLFKDKNYHLPWNKKDFTEQLEIYQQKGVLGLHLDDRYEAREQILNLAVKGVQTAERDDITFIFTNTNGSGKNNVTWREITKQVKSFLQ